MNHILYNISIKQKRSKQEQKEGKQMLIECPANTRLQDYLLQNDIHILTACGGRGNCAKCVVRIIKGHATVNTMDQIWFSEEQLLAGDLDMFFGYNSVSNTRLSYETIYEDCLVAILPKSHPAVSFAESKESCVYPWLDLAHVRKERFILQHSNQSIRQLEEDALFYADVLPELTYKISSIDAGIRLAEQGYGIAFTLNSYLTSMKLSPDSVVLQIGDPDMRIPFSAAFRKEDENRKELKEWIRLTKELVSRQ
mgnify:CR=1 FL=1